MKIDPKKLNKKDLFYYMSTLHPDEDYRSTVMLLMNCLPDGKWDMYDMLYYCVHNNKKLIAVYPGLVEAPPTGATFVTDIFDGALYYV